MKWIAFGCVYLRNALCLCVFTLLLIENRAHWFSSTTKRPLRTFLFSWCGLEMFECGHSFYNVVYATQSTVVYKGYSCLKKESPISKVYGDRELDSCSFWFIPLLTWWFPMLLFRSPIYHWRDLHSEGWSEGSAQVTERWRSRCWGVSEVRQCRRPLQWWPGPPSPPSSPLLSLMWTETASQKSAALFGQSLFSTFPDVRHQTWAGVDLNNTPSNAMDRD